MKKITISGVIGWDSTPAMLRDALTEANGDDVELVVSSPGGYVGEALEMFNLVRNYDGLVSARLSGYAMSAASYIPMAASEVVVEDNAVMMIHNAQGVAIGDHNAMTKYGNVLRGLSSLLAGAYSKKTGKDKEEVQALLDAETWMYGQEIIDAGFADRMIDAEEDGDKDEVTALAGIAFESMLSTLRSDPERFKQDISRASAMLGDIANRATKPPVNHEEPTMDLKELKEKHPDLVAAIAQEATSEMEAKVEEARQAGATDERERAAGIRALSVPGHEKLVEELVAYGSTIEAAALVMVKAVQAERETALENFRKEAPDGDDQPGIDNQLPANPVTEEQAKAKWDKDAKLRSEFMSFEDYWAYIKPNPHIKVKVSKRGE